MALLQAATILLLPSAHTKRTATETRSGQIWQRFRKIPNVEIKTSLFIICGDEQYRIISAEDVRGRGMYIEVLAEKQEGTVR